MSQGRILIVEDEKDLRDVYEVILRHAGYEICTSANGKEGLEEVKNCQPDLVLLDIFMPVMDGRGFMESIDLKEYPHMNVVVFSNTSDDGLIGDMLKLGAEKVVTKADLSPTDLTVLVEPYLKSAA
jgi:CheY-like chemotaxis protein